MKNIIKNEAPFIAGSIALVWQAIFFYLPLISIIILSLTDSNNFSFSNFSFFFDATYFLIIIKSILLAFLTACLCFLIGYPAAHFITFKAGKFKILFLFLLILPFWINFLLHIYSWFYVLERTGFLNNILLKIGLINKPIGFMNSIWAIIPVMVHCYISFMVLPIYSILERIDKRILEASADLGASAWQTFYKVILPIASNGIKSGFFLVLVPAFGEFAIPGLMGGEKFMFVGTVITQYILGYKTMPLGAAFTILSCLILLLVVMLIFFILNRRRSRL